MTSTSLPAQPSPPASPATRLPAAPLLLAGIGRAVWVAPDGELLDLAAAEAVRRARETPPMLCHARATARRLNCDPFPAFDLLELFAFVRPASFCAPTPHGLAQALGQPKPGDAEAAAIALPDLAHALMAELAARAGAGSGFDRDAPGIAWQMAQAGWAWGPYVLHALGFGAGGAELPRRADIAAEAATGRVVLRRDGKVASASIDLGSLVASGPTIETVTLQRLTARLGPLRPGDSDPSGDTLEELDLVGEVLGVALPAGRGGLLGDQIDRLSFDSTLVGGIPPGKPEKALPAWRERGGRWQFRRLAVLWGPLDLTADGVLALDEAMRPAGEFETEMKGAGKIIDRLIENGEIKPEAAFAARLALAAMGRPDSVTGESVLAAPISLRQGMLYLGPIPLVPIAPVL